MIKRILRGIGRSFERHLCRPLTSAEITADTTEGSLAVYETKELYLFGYKGSIYAFYKSIDKATGSFRSTMQHVAIGLKEQTEAKMYPLSDAGLLHVQKTQGRALFLAYIPSESIDSLTNLYKEHKHASTTTCSH